MPITDNNSNPNRYKGAWWTDKYCPNGCGCKLRTDGKEEWCSSVGPCNYVREIKKEIKENEVSIFCNTNKRNEESNGKRRITITITKKENCSKESDNSGRSKIILSRRSPLKLSRLLKSKD